MELNPKNTLKSSFENAVNFIDIKLIINNLVFNNIYSEALNSYFSNLNKKKLQYKLKLQRRFIFLYWKY